MLYLLKNLFFIAQVHRRFPTVKIHPTAVIGRPSFRRGDIILGEEVELLRDVQVLGKVTIGNYSYLNTRTTVFASSEHSVTIGNFCSIAWDVSLIAANSHDPLELSTYPVRERIFKEPRKDTGAPIEIGHDVWIGAETVILPGVTIGTGAIIGAGSVVTSGTKIEPYEVWVGNPARKVKDRFPEDIKRRLLSMRWWEGTADDIRKNKELFEKPVM